MDLVELNKTRLKLQLQVINNEVKPGDTEAIKKFKVYFHGKQIGFEEIDFNKDCVFICPIDLLGLIGQFGLLKLNNISLHDTSTTAKHSTIRTTYMIVKSDEAKYARLDNEYQDVEEIPEQFRPTNFIYKDLVLWRLVLDAGLGSDLTMYRITQSLIENRNYSNKLNWMFFIGTEDQFISSYKLTTPYNLYVLACDIKQQATLNEVIKDKNITKRGTGGNLI